MKKVVFSVPCFNAKPWIEDCVKSIYAQEGIEKTVVVYDDWSTDGTYEKLEELARTYPLEIRKTDQPRRGPYWIVNRIIENFPSPYYQTLDADDMLTPGATADLFSVMEQTGALIVGGQGRYIDEDGNPTQDNLCWSPVDVNTFLEMDRIPVLINSGKLMDARVFDRIGLYNDDFICAMDTEYIYRAAQAGVVLRNSLKNTVLIRLHKKTESLTVSAETGAQSQYRQKAHEMVYSKYPRLKRFGVKYLQFFQKELSLQPDNYPLLLLFRNFVIQYKDFAKTEQEQRMLDTVLAQVRILLERCLGNLVASHEQE